MVRRGPSSRLPLIDAPLRTQLTAILLLSTAIQLVAGWLLLFRPTVLSLDMDEQEYWRLAGQILAGVPIEVGRRTIVFPLFIAGLRKIADNVMFVQIAVSMVSATAAPLLALVVRKLTRSTSAAILAGAGLALWPAQVFYSSSLYSETLALPVFLLFLLILPLRCSERGELKVGRWVLAGAVLGLAAHVRPMYQLFLPVLAMVLLLDLRRMTDAAGRFALIVVGFAAVVLPWSVYVSGSLGHPVLLTANGGETLAGGFNPQLLKISEQKVRVGNRTTWFGPGKWVNISDNGFLTTGEQSLPYARQDQLMRERTIAWIKSDPGDAAYLAWRKISYMWGIYPFAFNGIAQAIFGNALTLLLMALFVLALVQTPQVRLRCARLYLLPLFVTGVALISWGSWRFRLPGDAGMIGVVAAWLSMKLENVCRPLHQKLESSPCTTL